MQRNNSRAPGAFALLLTAVFVGATVWVMPRDAHADEDEARAPESEIGLGVRLRRVHLPTAMLELFLAPVKPSGGGAAHTGIGGEIIRQKGNFVISLGAEYERISAQDGLYLERGQTIPQSDPDYVHFDDFRWVGVDLTFMWQQSLIGEFLSIRYGAGLGAGYILGEIERTDYRCTSSDIGSCGPDPDGLQNNTPEDSVPPVFPIVNVVVGAQFRPFHNLAINLEGGIRTLPFFGTTVALMF